MVKNNKFFEAIEDNATKRIIGRLKKGTDLLNGIINVCKAYHVQAGSFQCIGSLAGVGFKQFEQKADGTLLYAEPTILNEPAELLAGTGFIGLDEQNDLELHYHGVFLDQKGNLSGGHFIRENNPIAITMEFMIYPTYDAMMKKHPDPAFNNPIFRFNTRR